MSLLSDENGVMPVVRHDLCLQRQAAFILSQGDQVLIYFMEVWEYSTLQIIWDATVLTGYRFPLCLKHVPVLRVKMAEIAMVSLGLFSVEL